MKDVASKTSYYAWSFMSPIAVRPNSVRQIADFQQEMELSYDRSQT